MEHKLEVDIHAHWNENPPVYRIYINDEIFTERTFGWISYQYYLTEHLYCDLSTGVHTLRLENLSTDGIFELDALKVNNQPVNKNLMKSNGSKIEWQFIVDLINQNSHANHINVKLDDELRPVQKIVTAQAKKYETNLALVNRMREYNNQATKK